MLFDIEDVGSPQMNRIIGLWEEFSKALFGAAKKLDDCEDAAKSCEKATKEATKETKKFNEVVEEAQRAVGDLAGTLLSLPIVGAAGLLGSEYQQQMREIAFTSNLAKEEQEKLGLQLRQTSIELGVGRDKLVELSREAQKLGRTDAKEIAAFAREGVIAQELLQASAQDVTRVFKLWQDELKLGKEDTLGFVNVLRTLRNTSPEFDTGQMIEALTATKSAFKFLKQDVGFSQDQLRQFTLDSIATAAALKKSNMDVAASFDFITRGIIKGRESRSEEFQAMMLVANQAGEDVRAVFEQALDTKDINKATEAFLVGMDRLAQRGELTIKQFNEIAPGLGSIAEQIRKTGGVSEQVLIDLRKRASDAFTKPQDAMNKFKEGQDEFLQQWVALKVVATEFAVDVGLPILSALTTALKGVLFVLRPLVKAYTETNSVVKGLVSLFLGGVGLVFAVSMAINAFQALNALIKIGTVGNLLGLGGGVGRVITMFGNWAQLTWFLTKRLLGLGVTLVTRLVPAIGLVAKGLLALFANPVGLVILGIAAAVGVAIAVWKNWDKVVSFSTKVWKGFLLGIENTKLLFFDIVEFVKAGFNRVVNFLKGNVGLVKDLFLLMIPGGRLIESGLKTAAGFVGDFFKKDSPEMVRTEEVVRNVVQERMEPPEVLRVLEPLDDLGGVGGFTRPELPTPIREPLVIAEMPQMPVSVDRTVERERVVRDAAQAQALDTGEMLKQMQETNRLLREQNELSKKGKSVVGVQGDSLFNGVKGITR